MRLHDLLSMMIFQVQVNVSATQLGPYGVNVLTISTVVAYPGI